jgi:hypothetical protein
VRRKVKLFLFQKEYSDKKKPVLEEPTLINVPGTGLEPARALAHTPLKRARLPISPPGQFWSAKVGNNPNAQTIPNISALSTFHTTFGLLTIKWEKLKTKNFGSFQNQNIFV